MLFHSRSKTRKTSIVISETSFQAPSIATDLAEDILRARDPALVAYLSSPVRTQSGIADRLLIAERIAELAVTHVESVTAAATMLEAESQKGRMEIQRLEAELAALKASQLSRLQVAGISLGVFVAGSGVVAGIAQVLQYFAGR